MPEPDLFPNAPKPEQASKPARIDAATLAMSQSLTALGSRLRVMEERYANLRHKTQVTDQNMLELEKGLREEVKNMRNSLESMHKDLEEVSRRSLQIAEELRNTVKESDFKVLQKYMDFWDPLEFVTREEVERVLGLKKTPIVSEEPESDAYDSGR